METLDSLRSKRCKPCEGGAPAIPVEEAKKLVQGLAGWTLSPGGREIRKEYFMKDFLSAIRAIHEIAAIAEIEGHHPDLHLTAYRRLDVVLSTHAIGGLSENDFILAAKIEALPKELK